MADTADGNSKPDIEHKYWYNMKTGVVEHGFVSPSPDRVGPFDTHDAATHALDTLRQNSQKWAEEDAEENR